MGRKAYLYTNFAVKLWQNGVNIFPNECKAIKQYYYGPFLIYLHAKFALKGLPVPKKSVLQASMCVCVVGLILFSLEVFSTQYTTGTRIRRELELDDFCLPLKQEKIVIKCMKTCGDCIFQCHLSSK